MNQGNDSEEAMRGTSEMKNEESKLWKGYLNGHGLFICLEERGKLGFRVQQNSTCAS
jgi:hypothetical protein